MPNNLNIIFMGTPKIAADILEQILKGGINIAAVVTRPDKPKGRGKEVVESEVKQLAVKNNIPVYTPATKAELTETVEKLKPDMVVVAAFGMMLPPAVFETPKYKALNVHPSLLPKYRGPAPISAPILNGDDKTGVTIMLISEGMDEGDILAVRELPLTGLETAPELEEKLTHLGGEMLVKAIPQWTNGEITPQRQDDSHATYTKLLKKEDGRINWQEQTASAIERMSRAYQPWPGIYSFWKDKKIDFYDVRAENLPLEPGKVAIHGTDILIGTKSGVIIPGSLKLEGKNKVTAEDFIRGYSDFIGSKLI